MTTSHYDATGVLVLDRVTPVITALFGGFRLDAAHPGDGQAYIASIAESRVPHWNDIQESLQALCHNLALYIPDGDEESIENYLALLASHFDADQDVALGQLIEQCDFSESADLGVLFDLARSLDDGHGLKGMKLEGCWHCDKARLFEFGGNGEFYGLHVFMQSSSSSALSLGQHVEEALEAGDLVKAADLLRREVDGLLNGIADTDTRDALRARIGASLAATPPQDAGRKGFVGAAGARLFMEELLDSVQTLGCIAEVHGTRTLCDLMYLQSAILSDTFIDHYPNESAVLPIVLSLPSCAQWVTFIKVEGSMQPIVSSCGARSISDDDLCARCGHCDYQPGELSKCALSWPGFEDHDGYVQKCSHFPTAAG